MVWSKWILIGISVILLFLSSCQNNLPDHKNIILIVSDALRADMLSCYGGEARTPNIDWLANNGVLFEKAYSTSPLTMPSCVGLFTGEYPDIYRKGVFPGPMPLPNYFVPEKKLLFTDKLKEKGYDLIKSIENVAVENFNCVRGFKGLRKFDQLPIGNIKYIEKITGIRNKLKAYKNTYELLNYLIYDTENRPFFILDWIIDPHSPYRPPDDLVDQISVDRNKLTKELPHYLNYFFIAKKTVGNWNYHEKKFLKDLYIKEVESVDERVGAIIKALKSKNLLNSTYIIFTSDHGEAFGEHGDWGHGQDYFDTLVHVPLILMGPGIHKGKREQLLPVSLIDLMTTLKDLLGLDYPENSQGISFARSLTIDSAGSQLPDAVNNRDIYFVVGIEKNDINDRNKYQEALLSDSYKLVVTRDNKYGLYNLLDDPDERLDISKENPVLVSMLLDKIAVIKNDNTKRREKYFYKEDTNTQSERKVDNDTICRLKALGYLQ